MQADLLEMVREGEARVKNGSIESGPGRDRARRDDDLNLDTPSAYFREVERFSLLTPARERELGKTIREGQEKIVDCLLYETKCCRDLAPIRGTVSTWKKAPDKTPLSVDDVINMSLEGVRLAARKSCCPELKPLKRRMDRVIRKIKVASEEMVQGNLRLAVSIAKRYLYRGLSFADLIQEGNIGLMKAVSRYDYRTGYRFSTFASWWIRQTITRAIYDQARTIRIPIHLLELRGKYYRAFYDLLKELGREPSVPEVAGRVGVSENKLLDILHLARPSTSLETPVGEDGDVLADFLENPDASSAFDDLGEWQMKLRLGEALGDLDDREQRILRMRFGLGQERSHTLEEVGREFSLSRERVRQIEKRALGRLSKVTQNDGLKDLLE